MDAGLAVRWPFSPFATALAAGALFAFCLALWRQAFSPKNRRDSDPGSSTNASAESRDPGGGSTKICLSKSKSESSFLTVKEREKQLPSVCNYSKYQGRSPVPIIRLPSVALTEFRPYTLNEQLINFRRFAKLYSLPSTRTTEFHKFHSFRFETIHGYNFDIFPKLVPRLNAGSVYSRFPRHSGLYKNFYCYNSGSSHDRFSRVNLQLPHLNTVTGISELQVAGPITQAAKSVLGNDFSHVEKEHFEPDFGIRKRNINAIGIPKSHVLQNKENGHFEESERASSNDLVSRNNYSSNELRPERECFEDAENEEFPPGLGNCQDVNVPNGAAAEVRDIGVKKSINSSEMNQEVLTSAESLEHFQGSSEGVMTPQKCELSFALEKKQTIGMGSNNTERVIGEGETLLGGEEEGEERAAWDGGVFRVTNDRDVTGRGEEGEATSRTRTADEREARSQMDRGTGERSVSDAVACAPVRVFESSVTSETRIRANGDARVSTAVVSSVTFDDAEWSSSDIVDTSYRNGRDMSVRTVVSNDRGDFTNGHASAGDAYRPTFEEFMPVQSTEGDSLEETIKELNEIAGRPLVLEESPPRVTRLLGLLSRDEERRARAQLLLDHPEATPGTTTKTNGSSARGESIDGEWDRILRDVLASVSELEHWEKDEQRRRRDVTPAREDAEDDPRHQSRSSLAMEEEALSPKGETPTKVKNLRFKLDPDIFDVPSDDSFYDDEEDDSRRSGWRRQTKYRAFSTLELSDEPVKLVSVHASVVPAGHKMVARPVGIDLRVRLTEERQSKRAHVGTSPSQAKRRSPVSDSRIGWCQELSPVTENVDWRETFTNVPKENNVESKPVPNGILKTPSPKVETITKDSSNPFKLENGLTNGNGATVPLVKPVPPPKPVLNGNSWNPPQRKFSLPRKKFEPDPEAIERITGYKIALSKPPLPPPVFHKTTSPIVGRSRADLARKQYLDSKAALSAPKADGSRKFQQFLVQAQNDRARIVTSVPDLGAIERAVNEKWAKEKACASPRESPARDENGTKQVDTPSSRGSTPDDAWASYVQTCRKHLGRRSQSLSYLETEIDIMPVVEDDDKWRSTSALDEPDSDDQPLPVEDSDFEQSREDLDDSGRAKSEHELRIQRSLQSLPLPDWYKKSEKPKTGFLLKSSEKEKRGWAAAKSLASSTSSLASCGLKRPIHSLRSSRENITWSRGSASPDGPALSLALARAFREPYLGWRAHTSTSSGVSSSPRTSPPSWCAATTDEEVNGISFDGEDAFGRTSSEDGQPDDPPSRDDTGADAVTVSMDTGEIIKLPGGEDTCDDINNMSMDTCELFDTSIVPDVEDVDEPSPQADTGDDIDNLSTDTTEDKRKDPKLKRYSYSQSIYHSEWEDEESRGDRKGRKAEREPSPSSDPDQKVIWIESSFVGSRTTTSIVVLPEDRAKEEAHCMERPASR